MSKPNIEAIYPLSPMQQGMLFHSLYAPGSGTYVEQMSCHIEWGLDLSAFQRCWQTVVDRHSVLRTSLLWEGLDKPLQVVHASIKLDWEQRDWRHLNPARQAESLNEFLEQDREMGFDLTRAPLMRLALLRTGQQSYYFVWTSHHVLLDGWSNQLVLKEVFTCYESYSRAERVELKRARPYREYIAWVERQDMQKAEAFWREELKGITAPTPLVWGRNCATRQEAGKVEQSVRLNQETTRQLEGLARRAQVTVSMLVEMAWAVVLSRYSGETEVVFGETVSGRSAAVEGIETMVGLMINTLPVRVEVRGEQSVSQMLKKMMQRQARVVEYEHSPLMQVQGWSEVGRGRNLFETLYVFQNYPVEAAVKERAGSMMRIREVRQYEKVNYAAMVVAVPGKELTIRIAYEEGRFGSSEMKRVAEQMRVVLEGIARDEHRAVRDIEMLMAGERQQLIAEWNDTAMEEGRQHCTHEKFQSQAERSPDAVAAVYDQHQLSYGELDRRANRLANHLRRVGLGPEERVALCSERGLEMIIALLGVLKAGAAYVPLDPGFPQDRLAYMLEDSQARVLVTQQSLTGMLSQEVARVVCLDADWEQIGRESDQAPAIEVSPRNLAYVIYTSGSTGKPKGVGIEHGALTNFMTALSEKLDLSARDTLLAVTSLSFDISMLEIFLPLVNGACVVVASKEDAGDGGRLMGMLDESGATHMQATPATWRLLMETGWDGGAGISALCGGEALAGELAKGLREASRQAWNLYGPTETTIWSTACRIGEGEGPVTIGRPIANTQVYVLDERYEPVAVGAVGELHIGGEGLARGYENRAEATAERFIADAFGERLGGRLYRTGDLARYGEDGEIEYLGRMDQQVKVRGYRIEMGEIEAVLSQQDAIKQCAVIVREDEPGDRRIVAYVVAAGEQELSSREMREHLVRKLPDYMIPAAYVTMRELPLTANGKLDRKALPAPSAIEVSKGEEGPRTPIEEIVAGIWAEVLKVGAVGAGDNFFELGGHSLLATQVVSRVREVLGVEVALRVLFESPTVAGMAEAVERERRAGHRADAPPIVIVSREQELGLSFAQQRLWFIHRLEPDNAAYNIPMAVRLGGRLNITALRHSLQEIARRHEVLRTRFEARDGQPVQVIEQAAEINLPVWDISDEDQEQREAKAREIAKHEAARAFDLEQGPVWRAALLRMDEDDHILLVCVHHIASDGWSTGVIVREFTTLYEAMRAGISSPLAELGVQYADFAMWQREWLRGEALEHHLSYWRGQLSAAPVLELPTDRPRPATPSHRGARAGFVLSGELTHQLKQLSRREGVTLFMTLLAAYQVVLGRYSDQHDVVVGTDVANRNQLQTESLIGFFVNQLVLRADLSGNPSFRKLLKQVRERTLSAYEHQDVPFEKLVEELAPQRDLARSPLFQVKLVLQNAPGGELRAAGVSFSAFGEGHSVATFDLTLSLAEGKQGVSGVAEYATDLYDANSIQRLLEHLRVVLESMSASAEQRIAEVALLTPAERQQMVEEWNSTGRVYAQHHSVQEIFEQQAARHPDSVAVVCEQEQMSYGELNERANRLAHYLMSMGVGPEVKVALCVERSLEMMVGLMGVLKAGGAYVPMDASYPAERLAYMLADAQAPVLITRSDLSAKLPSAWVQAIEMDTQWELISGYPAINPRVDIPGESLAYMIYTSGSLGLPKGVMISNHSLRDSTLSRLSYYDHRIKSYLLLSSFAFDSSIVGIFWTLIEGGRLVIPAEDARRDPFELNRMIADYQVSHLLALPSLYELILGVGSGEGLDTLRTVIVAGESCYKSLLSSHRERLPQCLFVNEYGPTEGTVWSTAWKGNEETRERIPIGKPIENTSALVLNENQELVPVGVVGELYIGGSKIARGYLNRAELTAERFVPDGISGEAGGRLYRTGDQVRWRADGELEFFGRTDEQVKVRGYRIELGEIEAVLAQYDAVKQCAVIVREDEPGDKRIVAYVVAAGEQELSSREMREHLVRKLPDYMLPSAYVTMRELPLTANGKLDRKVLPAPSAIEVSKDAEGGRTPIEEIVAGVWAEVLKAEAVGVADNFFELGGHSLLATQVVSRVREVLGVEVALRVVFESPTVAGMAEAVERERRAGHRADAPPIVAVNREQELPLSFAQQRLWFIQQLEPDNPAYNAPVALRLTGPLNHSALEQSLSEIVRRHEALRTTFADANGHAFQVINKESTAGFPIADLRSFSPPEQREAVERLSNEEAQRPFDLAKGPMLRAFILALDEQDKVILFTMHHIVCDGWSMSLFTKEVGQLYATFATGKASPIPELEIQYADYAVWQREWLKGELLRAELEHWKNRLQGIPARLNLPADRLRPEILSLAGAAQSVQVSKRLTDELNRLRRQEGVTLFMMLTTILHTLLHWYTGQDHIVVGTDIANRNRIETEALIGFFVNVLPLHADLSGNPNFRELLQQVRHLTLEAYEHQDVPFEKIVESLHPNRVAHEPLVQVLFVFQNTPSQPLKMRGLNIAPLSSVTRTAKFEMTLTLSEGEQGISGELEYSTDLYNGSTITGMIEQFLTLLETVASHPDITLGEIRTTLDKANRRRWVAKHNEFKQARPRLKQVMPVPVTT